MLLWIFWKCLGTLKILVSIKSSLSLSLSLSSSLSGVYVHLGNQERALAIHRAAGGCGSQTATRWDLWRYWITFWMIDDVIFAFGCLLHDLMLQSFTKYIRLSLIFVWHSALQGGLVSVLGERFASIDKSLVLPGV